ncbi:MAG: GNAT family N-acetyltransferase [Methylotenera sp.]|uniref:GNAT family N-acetyltransferase n=1 Tax=Methylotenera sp. TaxID=2051956 RepID=UPI00248A8B9F|nr:GNAT family N-acetyltransferase [Methylotenera sp.]MDI1309198.1 GNAT family N-acetyltransferase [Methylotenera sp.]
MQHFRKAASTDVEAIVKLVNMAYRGEPSRAGWTTEADILDGLRTSVNEVKRLIDSENNIILLCLNDEELLGSICLEKEVRKGNDHNIAHIGMFVVHPQTQAKGIGKRLLIEAESLARQIWNIEQFQMHVITVRLELIKFYERRGYVRTGIVGEFPVNPDVWQPKLDGLQLETLEKFIPK